MLKSVGEKKDVIMCFESKSRRRVFLPIYNKALFIYHHSVVVFVCFVFFNEVDEMGKEDFIPKTSAFCCNLKG